MEAGAEHTVAVLALDSFTMLDVAAVVQAFGDPLPYRGRDCYAVVVCGVTPGLVRGAPGGVRIAVAHGLEALAEAHTIVVSGIEDLDTPVPEPVCEALRAARARGARVASICTGAFVLAAAGLLDGRRVATHWQAAADLAQRYPALSVDASVLYIDDGGILTSAGIAAALDLSLYMIWQDCGAEVANAVARRMVVAPQRPGGQAQFIEAPVPPGGGLARTRAWALERLGEPLTVERLAAHASVSVRTFERQFRAETGLPPARWLHQQRLLLARRLLETTDEPVERVARRAGFGSPVSLRTHFRRALGTSPLVYRRTFRRPTPPAVRANDVAAVGVDRSRDA
jgi:transcriptional regulator GlxA family with amidase domain